MPAREAAVGRTAQPGCSYSRRGVEVERISFEGRRATGLIFRRGVERFAACAAGEVILAAGAVASPKLLQLSGIGDAAMLGRFDIPIVHDLPGVGGNLQDHLQIRPVFKVSGARTLNGDYANLLKRAWMGIDYALFRNGPLTMAPSQLGMFARSSDDYATPNLQFHLAPRYCWKTVLKSRN